MRWFKDLYLGESILDQKEEVINKIKNGKFTLNKYVIALPRNDYDTLETYPAVILKEEWYKKSDTFIVGLATGDDEAKEVMQFIISDCYDQTGGVDVRKFIMDQMPILVEAKEEAQEG